MVLNVAPTVGFQFQSLLRLASVVDPQTNAFVVRLLKHLCFGDAVTAAKQGDRRFFAFIVGDTTQRFFEAAAMVSSRRLAGSTASPEVGNIKIIDLFVLDIERCFVLVVAMVDSQ